MKNLRIVFYVMRIGEIGVRLLEKAFKYGKRVKRARKSRKMYNRVNKRQRGF